MTLNNTLNHESLSTQVNTTVIRTTDVLTEDMRIKFNTILLQTCLM